MGQEGCLTSKKWSFPLKKESHEKSFLFFLMTFPCPEETDPTADSFPALRRKLKVRASDRREGKNLGLRWPLGTLSQSSWNCA
jgi:hypothetical protein